MDKNGMRSRPDDDPNNLTAGQLPNSLRSFFWDVDIDKISTVESAHFIIGRLMEHGDENAVQFLFKSYRRDQLVHALKTSRTISRRSRVFWQILLDMDETSCTPRRYPTPYGNC